MRDLFRIAKLNYKKNNSTSLEYFEVNDIANVLAELNQLELISKNQVIKKEYSSIILRVESLHVFDDKEEPVPSALKQWSLLIGNNYTRYIKND